MTDAKTGSPELEAKRLFATMDHSHLPDPQGLARFYSQYKHLPSAVTVVSYRLQEG